MNSLDALVQIIADSVKDVQSKCAERDAAYPTLDVPPSPETDKLQTELAARAAPAIAAAYQLIATLQPSQAYLVGMSYWAMFQAGLALTEAAFVPDTLREAGLKGLHVDDIAAVRSLDANKLGRTMRALATRHVFEEVSPDVFRNNRVSASMCTGKPIQEMLQKPDDRWDGTNGLAAMISMSGGILLRSAGSFVDNLLDPATGASDEPNESSFSRAHNTKLSCFEWLDLSGHEVERKRFGIAMGAMSSHSNDTLATTGFDWSSLAPGSKVVDVGGGVGNLTMALAKVHKHLKFIVQDRPGTAREGEALWRKTLPSYIESGAVQLQGHDFFEEQPVKDAAVFVTRYTTHNWSDKYAMKYLSRLREAARPDTRLIIIDDIQDYLSRGLATADAIPGAVKDAAPEPLLPYPETATSHAYSMDLMMMAIGNCQERTLGQFAALLGSAGWRVERVYRLESPLPPQLLCSPL